MGLLSEGKRFLLGADIKKARRNGESMKGISWFRPYHKSPIYLGGKEDNDYGNGFYTTEYEDRARSWAVLNGSPQNAIVNEYELELQRIRTLDLNDCGVLAWIAEVERMEAILLDGYVVPGITAGYVVQNPLVYNRKGGYYE